MKVNNRKNGSWPPAMAFDAYASEIEAAPATSTNGPRSRIKGVFYEKYSLCVRLEAVILGAYGMRMPFKLPRYVKHDTRPYVLFYAWHPDEQCLKRVRMYQPAGLKPHEAGRWRRSTISAIENMLVNGCAIVSPPAGYPDWLPSRIPEGVPESPPVWRALEMAVGMKGSEVRARTCETYVNVSRRMIEWLEECGRSKLSADRIGERELLLFSDWLLNVRKVTAVTRNNYFQTLRSVWSHIHAMGWCRENPFSNFKRIPQNRTSRNTAFTREHAEMLSTWMIERAPVLHMFTRMIYWSFARPVELLRLQVRDYDRRHGVLIFGADVTKNRKAGSVRLPGDARKMLEDYLDKWPNADPVHFLFHPSGRPSREPAGENTFATQHLKAIRACKLESQGMTLYSWKHTGVIAAYDNGMDLFELRDRCRHSSIEQTETYLRDMGRWRSGRQEMGW